MNILSRPRREFLNVCVFPSSYLFLSFHTADSRSVTTYVQSRVSTRMGVTSHMKHAYRTYRYHGEYLRMHLRSIVRCHSHAANQSTLFFFFFFNFSLNHPSKFKVSSTIRSIDTTRIERRPVLRYNTFSARLVETVYPRSPRRYANTRAPLQRTVRLAGA